MAMVFRSAIEYGWSEIVSPSGSRWKKKAAADRLPTPFESTSSALLSSTSIQERDRDNRLRERERRRGVERMNQVCYLLQSDDCGALNCILPFCSRFLAVNCSVISWYATWKHSESERSYQMTFIFSIIKKRAIQQQWHTFQPNEFDGNGRNRKANQFLQSHYAFKGHSREISIYMIISKEVYLPRRQFIFSKK